LFGVLSLVRVKGVLRTTNKALRGGDMQGDQPNWEPLLELAPEEIDDFMWMFEVELEDGAMVQAYKHWWTRGYVHLDFAGRAFVFTEDNLYAEVDGEKLLAAVLRGRESRAEIVRDNGWVDDGKITWARSATRHRVSHEDAAYVIEHAGLCFEGVERCDGLPPPLFFFGADSGGRELEVVAVELSGDRLRVIHVSTLRDRFGIDYLEALGWRT
jgi:hypothetical protein